MRIFAPWLVGLGLVLDMSNPAQAAIPRFSHIIVIVMENHSDNSIAADSQLRYLHHLMHTYSYDDNYYGVTHPSLPNYVAMLTGDIWGSHSDNPNQRFPHTSLVNELDRAHLTWKAYMQSLPHAGYEGSFWPPHHRTALYVMKHDPFMVLPLVRHHQKLANRVVPLRELPRDLRKQALPDFSYIVPNVCHDMHGQPGNGPCSNNRHLMRAGDRFLHAWVRKIIHAPFWRQGNNVIFITWDESDHDTPYHQGGPDAPIVPVGAHVKPSGGVDGGGRVPLIAIWNRQKHPRLCHEWADHYSLLRTIEKSWHLSFLGHASDPRQVRSLNCFFGPKRTAGG